MPSTPHIPPGCFLILYFASASSFTSKDSEFIKAPLPLPVSRLFEVLEQRYVGMTSKVLDSCLVTINLEYVDIPDQGVVDGNERMIKEGDEVAIIPPVSSG